MLADFNTLPEHLHIHLERQALAHAAYAIARHADVLASEYEAGTLADHGGAAALRLMGQIVRMLTPGGSLGASRA